jgi:hypothetical protein
MLGDGYTPEEVSNYLKQKHKHRRYWMSAVTLNEYRNNFLNLDRDQLKDKRKELLASGNTKDVNAIDTFSATKEFVEAKQKATEEVISAIHNFKEIQDKIKERIAFIDASTRDENGNPKYKARDEEIIQGYLTRLESMTVAFVKVSNDMKKQEQKAGTTEISINMAKMAQYQEAYKNIMQKILVKLDPSLLNDFVTEYNAEVQAIENGTDGSAVNISINNGGTTTHNISIDMGSDKNSNQSLSIPDEPMADMDAEVIDEDDEQNKQGE